MNKFLLGLVLGTVLGFLVAGSFRNKAIGPTDGPVATSVDRELEGSARTAATGPAQTGVQTSISASHTGGSSANKTPVDSAATAPAEPAGPIPATAQNSPPSTQSVHTADPTKGTSGQPRTPIAVPEAMQSFLQKTDTHDGLTLAQTHAKLEEEADDLAWSYQMELYLQQSLARPTKSGQPLDVRIIECRTTMCEIAGFSTLPNPIDDLTPILQQMSQQPWWDFDNMNSTAEGDTGGGKFMIFLRRKR